MATIAASMANVTIASTTIANWQRDSDVQLRVYALVSFEAADGTLVVQGNPSEDQLVSNNFYAVASCSLSGTTLTIGSIELESTTDSKDNPAATYGAYFYTTEGERIGAFGAFATFVLPAAPTSTTWAAIELAQQGLL